jgi:hypothetical protein
MQEAGAKTSKHSALAPSAAAAAVASDPFVLLDNLRKFFQAMKNKK